MTSGRPGRRLRRSETTIDYPAFTPPPGIGITGDRRTRRTDGGDDAQATNSNHRHGLRAGGGGGGDLGALHIRHATHLSPDAYVKCPGRSCCMEAVMARNARFSRLLAPLLPFARGFSLPYGPTRAALSRPLLRANNRGLTDSPSGAGQSSWLRHRPAFPPSTPMAMPARANS